MSYNPDLTASAELHRVIRQVRNCLDAIGEANTDVWKHILAIGDNLNVAHDGLVPERRWGRFLKDEFSLSRTKAFRYGLLAKHRAQIERFVSRAKQTGQPLSIATALSLIGHGPNRTPRPKTFNEIAEPAALGRYLEANRELLFEALSFAPMLKAEIGKRLERPLGHRIAKTRAKAEREIRPPLIAAGDRASFH